MTKISPSILSCDFSKLKEDIDSIIEDIDYLHIDVMDGLFVKNISFGIPVIKSLRPHYKTVFDTHLMIVNPERYISAFADAGADLITFHVEATNDSHEVIKLIRSKGLKVGVSIKPSTPVAYVADLLSEVDLVLVMSVEPGFGGQEFDPEAINKIQLLKALREEKNYHYEIEVDGGINSKTGPLCVAAGADVLVSGSYIFKAKNRKEAIDLIK